MSRVSCHSRRNPGARDKGYAFDSAQASFELIARDDSRPQPTFFEISATGVRSAAQEQAKRAWVKPPLRPVVVVKIGDEKKLSVRSRWTETGTIAGPVNCVVKALVKDLGRYELSTTCALSTSKVRITNGGTEAVDAGADRHPRENGQGRRWSTVGASAPISSMPVLRHGRCDPPGS